MNSKRLSEHRYRTISSLSGPLIFVQDIMQARIGEVVKVIGPDGRVLDGEVLEIDGQQALLEIYGETEGLNKEDTTIVFSDAVRKAPLSTDMIGRVFDGSFRPRDNLPMFIPDKHLPVTGYPMNPAARARPDEYIETGISVIDGLNTLVKGQKLPLFSCPGLPSKELTASVLKHARLAPPVSGEPRTGQYVSGRPDFIVVFAALGLTFYEYSFYRNILDEIGSAYIAFVNMADEPVMERLLTPRFAITAAEYLAFDREMDVLVIAADMTNYCDALREVSTARQELPGRRGYPGYMYSDLSSLYERAGRIRGRQGSVTMIPVITMPEDDITHPIPDLTGYITEGQIVLSRELHQQGIFPPVDVLPSLSRLMQQGIGKEHTREDHRQIANLLYACYAQGRELRRLEAVVGREGMAEHDRTMLDFASSFEQRFVHQGMQGRTIAESLDRGIEILAEFSLEKGLDAKGAGKR